MQVYRIDDKGVVATRQSTMQSSQQEVPSKAEKSPEKAASKESKEQSEDQAELQPDDGDKSKSKLLANDIFLSAQSDLHQILSTPGSVERALESKNFIGDAGQSLPDEADLYTTR